MKVIRNGRYLGSTRALSAFVALALMSATSISCVSGGFRMTRLMAKWTNSQMIVLRILIYLLLGPVFLITELLDVTIFNTIDFWTGTISARNDRFEKNGEQYEIAHTRNPLRRSVITRTARDGSKTVTELRETSKDSVEVYVNGVKKAELQGFSQALSSLTLYDPSGNAQVSSHMIAPSDFASLESLPVAEGIQQVYARLGLLPKATLACE